MSPIADLPVTYVTTDDIAQSPPFQPVKQQSYFNHPVPGYKRLAQAASPLPLAPCRTLLKNHKKHTPQSSIALACLTLLFLLIPIVQSSYTGGCGVEFGPERLNCISQTPDRYSHEGQRDVAMVWIRRFMDLSEGGCSGGVGGSLQGPFEIRIHVRNGL